MPGSSLFTLLDDIATLLDDVAVMTKVAAKKTAGILGDDLALNAEQVTGISAHRELPVVWAVAKGSLFNKLLLVPLALLISAVAPSLVTALLMLGGAFLCFEGLEKLAHKWLHGEAEEREHHDHLLKAVADPQTDMVAFERGKIAGAIRTDFILSAEIITITLGTVAQAPLGQRVAVLSSIAVLITVAVYGLVAGIVKLDDAGLYLSRRQHPWQRRCGAFILRAAPYLMKGLSLAGTAAMFLVGGGILTHGIGPLREWQAQLTAGSGGILSALVGAAMDGFVGIIMGALALALVSLGKKALRRPARPAR